MGLKVAVLMGGKSLEREISLESGKHVSELLEAAGHKVIALDITSDLVPTLRSERPDVAWIALHGKHGDDGTVQALLEFLGIPFVGTTSQHCRIAWDKSTESFVHEFIPHPDFEALRWPHQVVLSADAFKSMGAATAIDRIAEAIPGGLPVIVQPAKQGSALGTVKVEKEEDLADALLFALSYDDKVVIKEYIDGVEVAVPVLGEGGEAYALPPVEISVKDGGLFDFSARTESDKTEYFVPVRTTSLANATDEAQASAIRSQIERSAVAVYTALGLRDFGRVDMIWDGAQACILDCSVSPGFTPKSLFPMAAHSADISLEELCSELVEGAALRGSRS